MALNILAQTQLADLTHLGADHVQLLSEAFALAMAERDRHIGDPQFGAQPLDELLSAEVSAAQYARIDLRKALAQPAPSALLPEHRDTVYLTVVDRDRNVCSMINSVFHSWGSGLVAGDTGINLQNRGAGFNLQEGHSNCIEPGKRPLHTIIPSMVYRDGKPVLSFGVMGGQYQAMGQSYVLSNWLDYGMDVQEALDAARFFLYDGELSVEQGVPEQTRQTLRARGHRVVAAEEPHGGGQAIYLDWRQGSLHGGSDPRKDGLACGY